MKAPRFFNGQGSDPAAFAGALLAAVAVLIAFVSGTIGINGLFPNGHFASTAAIGIGGDNMWRWHTFLPVTSYLERPPISSDYYMHHPLGVFWTAALFGKLFGFHNWVLRLPPVIYVTATPFLLYRIGRDLWGPLEGGVAALAFVALPITLGYTNYHDLEQPVMFGTVVAAWGYVRFVRTWRERYALLGALGFFFALNIDWQAYVWGVFFLGWLFVRGYLLPERMFGPLRARPFGRLWALFAIAGVAAFGIEIIALDQSGRLSDLLSSFFGRTAGDSVPLEIVLAARRYRIELMFTGLGIALGKLALVALVGRLVVKRSESDVLPLIFLASALVQYVGFKQGADVHIFWPHTFAAYFGLGAAALVATARDALAWLAPRLPDPRDRLRRAGPWIALALVGLPVLLVLKDGLSLDRLSRESGGRFAEANLPSLVDASTALRWFRERVPETSATAVHSGVLAHWALQWEARPGVMYSSQSVGTLTPSVRTYLLDTRAASVGELRAMAARYHVHAVGPWWLADPREPPALLSGYRFDEHEPALLEAWSQGRVEPVRSVVADPWVTWEWRNMLGQAATEPTQTPKTAEQLRVAHNIALARGDTATAGRMRASLAALFNWPLTATYDNGTTIIGAVRHRGAQRGFTLYLVAGTFKSDTKPYVHARVIAPPRLSTLPMDPADLELVTSPVWPTSLWTPGAIYSQEIVVHHRPGKERITATWSGLRRTDKLDPLEISTSY
jgi:4-amino-4-deoxy-L-arabinose transferase-like glycosyltransferase